MKAKKQKSVEETSRTRILVLLVVLGIAVFIPLIIKMYKIQIIDHDKYESMAIEQQTSEYSLTASRGPIYDRNYNMLAYSATAENIFLSPLIPSLPRSISCLCQVTLFCKLSLSCLYHWTCAFYFHV